MAGATKLLCGDSATALAARVIAETAKVSRSAKPEGVEDRAGRVDLVRRCGMCGTATFFRGSPLSACNEATNVLRRA